MSPDALILAWFEHRANADAPPSKWIVLATGRVYADRCGSTSRESRRARGFAKEPCDSKSRHPNRHGVDVCARCGDPWRFDERHSLKGDVKESKRPGGGYSWKDRMADVGLQLDRFVKAHRWEASFYIAALSGVSVERLVQDGALFPDCPVARNPFQVVQLVNEGRRLWKLRLIEAGLLGEEIAA